MIKLSIKNLASFALANACPRCLWVKHQLGYNTPFSIFPGVFSTIDSHCKRLCDFHLQAHNALPPWLEDRFPGYRPIKVPHYSKLTFQIGDVESRGTPDYVLTKDGKLVVLDNKTAHFKDADDPLAALYDVQLNACGLALEKNGHGKVESLHLVYYDPIRLEEGCTLPFFGSNPALVFEVKMRDVEVDTALVERTAAAAAKVLALTSAPAGVDGCKNCKKLDVLSGVLNVG